MVLIWARVDTLLDRRNGRTTFTCDGSTCINFLDIKVINMLALVNFCDWWKFLISYWLTLCADNRLKNRILEKALFMIRKLVKLLFRAFVVKATFTWKSWDGYHVSLPQNVSSFNLLFETSGLVATLHYSNKFNLSSHI